MKRILVVALAAIVAVLGLTVPAEAKPAPKPTWKSVKVSLVKPRLIGGPTQIWVTAENAGNPAWFAAAFMNRYTKTKFNCEQVIVHGGPQCTAKPCPTNGWCLRVRYGQLPEGVGARYEPFFCAGSCMRSGQITIDPDVPPFGGWHPWGPYERYAVVAHQFTRFIGLAENQLCQSRTDTRYHCNGDSTPDVLTASEAAYAASW